MLFPLGIFLALVIVLLQMLHMELCVFKNSHETTGEHVAFALKLVG